jgi:DNA-binding response OmpR family regulator
MQDQAAERRFLLVDGDPASARALAEQLGHASGAVVACVATAAQALSVAAAESFDLLVAATPLPDRSPEAFADALRAGGITAPILLIVAADAPVADAGMATLSRPFRLGALFARIDALLSSAAGDTPVAIGRYRFRSAEKLLVDPADAREIRLTEKEAAILDYLVQAGDRVTTRELLLNEVWGYNSNVTTHTLETHVYRLRRKIESDPAKAEILVSEPGGYRLAAVQGPGES